MFNPQENGIIYNNMSRILRMLGFGAETAAPETVGAGLFTDDRGPEHPYVDPTESLEAGRAAEADETARLSAELEAERFRLAGTLRAVLAERMVRASTAEFEAIATPDSERIRERRRIIKAAEPRDQDRTDRTLDTDAVMKARKRLGGNRISRTKPRGGQK